MSLNLALIRLQLGGECAGVHFILTDIQSEGVHVAAVSNVIEGLDNDLISSIAESAYLGAVGVHFNAVHAGLSISDQSLELLRGLQASAIGLGVIPRLALVLRLHDGGVLVGEDALDIVTHCLGSIGINMISGIIKVIQRGLLVEHIINLDRHCVILTIRQASVISQTNPLGSTIKQLAIDVLTVDENTLLSGFIHINRRTCRR